MLRPMWIHVFVLALLCTPARAVPGRVVGQERESRDDSSIQLKATHDPSYGASYIFIDGLPPGLGEMGELPPGLAKKDGLPPGLRDDWRAHEWRKRIAARPAVPTRDPRSASLPIPEPSGLVLFVGGLLLARAAVRRRRS